MIRETMTAQERLQAAIQLDEGVDRHPIFPLVVTAAPRLYGVTQAEAWRNHDAAREALLKCYQDFGYDFGAKSNYYYTQLPGRHIAAPVRNLIPGRNLGEDDLYQVDERVLFQREDYDRIAALGWNAFWDEHYPVMSGKPVERLARMQTWRTRRSPTTIKSAKKGMRLFLGAAVDSVVMAFSQCRTLTEFTMDLYYVPDKVEAAMKASWEDIITNGIQVCKQFDKKFCFVVLERAPGSLPAAHLRALRMALSPALRRRADRRGDNAVAAPGHRLEHQPPALREAPPQEVRRGPGQHHGHIPGQGGPERPHLHQLGRVGIAAVRRVARGGGDGLL